MKLHLLTGNLLDSSAAALVNTVNTVGVMGKGIAKQMRDAYPHNYAVYKQACKAGTFAIGDVLAVEDHDLYGNRLILNLPTKKHWRQPSRYEYIAEGLQALCSVLDREGVRSVAIPPLGCGNGGLDWSVVRPMIEKALAGTSAEVFLYEPNASIRQQLRRETRLESGKLTDARAMLLAAMYRYEDAEMDSASLFVANKLAYFIQRLGENLQLRFRGHYYGPFDHAVSKVLEHLNGSYVIGLEQGVTTAFESIELPRSRRSEVEDYLAAHATTEQRRILDQLAELLDGYSSTFALEVLATVDYVRSETGADTVDDVRANLSDWSDRKLELMQPMYVERALERLRAFEGVMVV